MANKKPTPFCKCTNRNCNSASHRFDCFLSRNEWLLSVYFLKTHKHTRDRHTSTNIHTRTDFEFREREKNLHTKFIVETTLSFGFNFFRRHFVVNATKCLCEDFEKVSILHSCDSFSVVLLCSWHSDKFFVSTFNADTDEGANERRIKKKVVCRHKFKATCLAKIVFLRGRLNSLALVNACWTLPWLNHKVNCERVKNSLIEIGARKVLPYFMPFAIVSSRCYVIWAKPGDKK